MTRRKTVEEVQVAKNFVQEITELVQDKKMEYLEAVLYYCQKTGLEIETAANLVKHNSKLRERLEKEAHTNNLLKK